MRGAVLLECDEHAPHDAEEEGLLVARDDRSECGSAAQESREQADITRCTRRRALLAASGIGLLAVCAVVAVTTSQSPPGAEAPSDSGLWLLASGDLHAATVEMLCKLEGTSTSQPTVQSRELQDQVAAGYRHYIEQVQARNPTGVRLLREARLSDEQKGSIVQLVRDVADERMQTVGASLGEAVRRGMPEGDEGVRRELEGVSVEKGPEIRQLSEEILPAFMRSSDEGAFKLNIVLPNHWLASATVQAERRLSILSGFLQSNTSSPDTDDEVNTTAGAPVVSSATQNGIEKAVSIIGSLVLEASTLLTDIGTVCKVFNQSMCSDRISPKIKASMDGVSAVIGLVNCFDAADNNKEGKSTNTFNQIVFGVCAAQYATQLLQMAEMLQQVVSGIGGGSSGGSAAGPVLTTAVPSPGWAWDNTR